MITIGEHVDEEAVAAEAVRAMLAGAPMRVHRPGAARRPGFPLPIKREPNDPDGGCTQDYRPIAVLEWLNLRALARLAAARRAADDEEGGNAEAEG